MTNAIAPSSDGHWPGSEPGGSARRVYLGIMRDLDAGRMVPGQRLAETELSTRFEVGRNAVREAMQHLAARGIIDLSPNRSPAIRRLDLAECFEVLDVAESMTRLTVRTAAQRLTPEQVPLLESAVAELTAAADAPEATAFGRARRNFYRTLLLIGGNRELQRLFPAVGIHIIHAQYPSQRLRGIRLADYRALAAAVIAGDADAAERAASEHVTNVRAVIGELAGA